MKKDLLFDQALDFIDGLVYSQKGKHLSSLERRTFESIWAGEDYKQVALACQCKEGDIKDSAEYLFDLISFSLEKDINRGNCQQALTRYFKQKETSNNPKPSVSSSPRNYQPVERKLSSRNLSDSTDLNFPDVLAWIDSLVDEKRGTYLTSLEQRIIKGIWLNKTYKLIAEDFGYSARYVNQMANDLIDLLEQIFNQKITKKGIYGLKALLERQYKEQIPTSENDLICPQEKEEPTQSVVQVSCPSGGNRQPPTNPPSVRADFDDGSHYRSYAEKLERIYRVPTTNTESHFVTWSQSEIANYLAKQYRFQLVWSVELQKWYQRCQGTEWTLQVEEFVGRLIKTDLEAIANMIWTNAGYKPVYSADFLNGIISLLKYELAAQDVHQRRFGG